MKVRNSLTTRRRLLQRSSGALLFAGAATSSGCTETLPPLGQQVRYGRVDVPVPDDGPGDPVYRRWLPNAGALPDDFDADEDDLDPGYVNYVEPGALGVDFDGDGKENRLAHVYQKPHVDYFGVGYENYDRVMNLHSFGTTFVFEGDVDPGVAGRTLVESGYSAAESYADYDVFDRANGRRTAAVRAGAIVWAHHDRSRAIVEAVIDAERGAVDRHHETDETFALATEAVGARRWTWFGGPGVDPTGDALESRSVAVDGDAIYNVYHLVYPDGESVPERAIRDRLEKHESATGALAVDLQVDGRVATIEIRRSHASVDDPYEGVEIPQITWGATRDGDAITIRHEAGETASADTLTFSFEGPDGTSPTDVQFGDTTDVVEPGDAITVRSPDDPGRTALLGEFSPRSSEHAASIFVVYKFP